jgi:hypothetical protein
VLRVLWCWLTGEPVRWRSEVLSSENAGLGLSHVLMDGSRHGEPSATSGIDAPYAGLVALTEQIQVGPHSG